MHAHPRLRLEQQQLRSKDGNGKRLDGIPMWKYLLQHPHIETVASPRVLSQREIMKWMPTGELKGPYSTINVLIFASH
jgi:hypothetical protein